MLSAADDKSPKHEQCDYNEGGGDLHLRYPLYVQAHGCCSMFSTSRWTVLCVAALSASCLMFAADDYPPGPDSERHADVPKGAVTKYTWTSKIFPGTVRDYWVYVPSQYNPDKPAGVMHSSLRWSELERRGG
jgi:hypothetical protein